MLAISVFCYQVMIESWCYENDKGHIFVCYYFVCVRVSPQALEVEERCQSSDGIVYQSLTH